MNKLRGLRDIPSITRLGRAGPTRAQYEYEVLNELAQLGREKVWLKREKEKWQERVGHIDKRLAEIAEIEESLRRHVAVKEEIAPDVQDADRTTDKGTREVIVKY